MILLFFLRSKILKMAAIKIKIYQYFFRLSYQRTNCLKNFTNADLVDSVCEGYPCFKNSAWIRIALLWLYFFLCRPSCRTCSLEWRFRSTTTAVWRRRSRMWWRPRNSRSSKRRSRRSSSSTRPWRSATGSCWWGPQAGAKPPATR